MGNQEKAADSSSQNEKDTSPKTTRPPPILCLGAPRNGSASLMQALQILGYPNVHHGWDAAEREDLQWQWPIFDRACDATFTVLPTYRGKPFSREEWNEVFGEYDAVSDVASYFAESLIPAYPDAKVILVERDVEKWYPSMVAVVKNSTSPFLRKLGVKLGDLSGFMSPRPCNKIHQGWTRAPSANDVIEYLKPAYARHNKYIRDTVPKEQLLDFKLADGWKPLCQFLGKEVPDVPFPHVNDSKEYAERSKRLAKKMFKLAARNLIFPCLRPEPVAKP
ncbi:uncharacterized protein FTJAE_610 [Fusarium tjaetaba]|uniref:P-loop containing nucleoside triphosphate hydrolase protein n=1 Tax=Fusarium tjaetaba TaxID=1567544 RepID=A0A8H5SE94_9HYPO|nr:uncharacterized protein FTJAE_610 [Fusarium tjaetaba]KAF5650187.1 hypothetical protein FTJAE_610 [Fusarium tjaetaba]